MTSGHFEFSRLSDDETTATFILECRQDVEKLFKAQFNSLNRLSKDNSGWVHRADVQIRRYEKQLGSQAMNLIYREQKSQRPA